MMLKNLNMLVLNSLVVCSVKIIHLKAENGWSDKSFTFLLKPLKDMLPKENELPDHTYEAKKVIHSMSIDYEKIYAWPKDCILYRKEYEHLEKCPVCRRLIEVKPRTKSVCFEVKI